MNEFTIELPVLLTASLTLSVSATVAWLALAWCKPAGHKIYRLVWFAVLINGVMLARVSVDLPVLNPKSSNDVASMFGEPIINEIAIAERDIQTKSVNTEPQIAGSIGEPHFDKIEAQYVSAVSLPTESKTKKGSFNLFQSMSWIWFTGFIVVLAFLTINYIKLLLFVSSAKAAPLRWSRQCAQICREVGLRNSVAVLVHERLGPALMLTPVGYRIVVPRQLWSEMANEQRSAVLRHEIEHYRRGDILTSLFAFFVAAVHWFNPFAWMAVGKLNLAAEWACDAAAVSSQEQQSHFARALLSISTSNTKYLIGGHGIGSSDLKLRIQRILGKPADHSKWGRAALSTLTLIILLSGWINLRLITESTHAASNEVTVVRDEAELEANIKELTKQLSRDGELNESFFQLTQTSSGLIAIGNSVAEVENELRNEASKQVVPEFFQTQVDRAFRSQLSKEVVKAKTDIANLKKALSEIKEQHSGMTDADKLFRRFTESKNAATVLYFSELREQMQPNQQMLMQHLGRFLAKRNDGKLIVRESAKGPLLEKLNRYKSADEQVEFLRSELQLLADELMAKDELHEKLKKRLQSSRGVGFVLAMAFDGETPLNDRITQYLQELEYFFEDAPDGLVINEEAREHLIQGMAEMDRNVARMEVLKGPLLALAKEIDDQNGAAEKSIKKFMQSEAGLAAISMRIDIDPNRISGMTDRIKSEILEETDGGWAVRADRFEEVSNFSKRMLRASRNLRRQLRIVDHRTASVPQEKLGKLFESTEAKMILVEKVKEFMQSRSFDAWPTWLEQHFEMIGDKFHVRNEAREMVEYLMKESEAIQRELANDDF